METDDNEHNSKENVPVIRSDCLTHSKLIIAHWFNQIVGLQIKY